MGTGTIWLLSQNYKNNIIYSAAEEEDVYLFFK
jgi:hypothetical protein